jgi:hypothetical protein
MKDETKKSIKLQLFIYFILISTFVIVGLISVFYLIFIQNNLALLNVINVALITMLVLINGAYGYFTWQIVDETRNDRKVEFIEKKLVKLYYPLKDIICKDCWNTNEIDVKLYLYLASNKLDESLNVYFKEQNKGVHQSLSDSEMSNLRENIEIIIIEDIERLKKELAELVN